LKIALSLIHDTGAKREHGSIASLKDSIASVGLINPLTLDEDYNLMAGRRRYQAVSELEWSEVECYVLPVEGSQVKAMSIAIEENIKRKDMTEVERLVALNELDEMRRGEHGSARQGERTDLTLSQDDKVWNQSKTAKAAKVTQSTISKAKKVAKAIGEYPELASYQKAAPVLKEYEKLSRRKQHIEPIRNDDINIVLGDFREELVAIADNSVGLVITDPPYPKEYIPLWGDMAKAARRILKPSGFLVAYSGQLYLDKVMALLGEYLTYYWMAGVWLIGAPSHRFERNIQNAFKPVLIYCKEPVKKQEEWIVDLLNSPSSDKQYHEWGQSEAPIALLIEAFSKPGDRIVEPFCGGGVVPYLCKKMNRKCLAIDNDKDSYEATLLRMANDKGQV